MKKNEMSKNRKVLKFQKFQVAKINNLKNVNGGYIRQDTTNLSYVQNCPTARMCDDDGGNGGNKSYCCH